MSTGMSFKTAIGIFVLLGVVLFLIGAVFFYAMLYLRGIGIESGYPTDSPLEEVRRWRSHPPQWFPDGGRIAFSHEGAVYVVDSAGSHLKLVDGGGDGNGGGFNAAYGLSLSPDGSQIAYSAYKKSSWEIYVAESDGSDQFRLTENDIMNLNPVWSPDGTRIFFDESTALYAVAADGSDSRVRVVDFGGAPIKRHFVLSPDGSHIVFVARESQERWGTYVVNTDGSNVRRLADNTGALAWSPDSRRIAYPKHELRDDEYVAAGIYTVAIEGSDVREIISFSGEEVGFIENISWSPDGSEILFGTTVVATDGSSVRELPGAGSHVTGSHASWSRDDSRIAVYNEVWRPGSVLYTVARDGTDARVLVEQNEDGSLVAAGGRPLK